MKQWLALLARLVVGGVWIWAGALKLPDPSGSIEAVRAYELLPGSLVEPVGLLLPPLEVVLGTALVLGVLVRGAGLLSALVLAAFVFGIAWVWGHGRLIDCGCFGGGGYDPDAADAYPWEIARDTALGVASLFLVWAGSGRLALDHVLFRRRDDATRLAELEAQLADEPDELDETDETHDDPTRETRGSTR